MGRKAYLGAIPNYGPVLIDSIWNFNVSTKISGKNQNFKNGTQIHKKINSYYWMIKLIIISDGCVKDESIHILSSSFPVWINPIFS